MMKHRILVTAIAAMFLLLGSACAGSQPKDPGDGEADEESSRQNVDTRGVRMGGEIYYEGAIPQGWPDDIPMMEGIHILWGRAGGAGEDRWLQVTVAGFISQEDFPQFYTDLPGWEVDESQPVIRRDGEVRMQFVKGNRRLELRQFARTDPEGRGDSIMHLKYLPG